MLPGVGPVVTPMRRRHLRGVTAIEDRTNPTPWSLGLFLGELRMPTSRAYFVSLDGHRVTGYCGVMLTGEDGHITNVAVDPERRRQQLATRLLLVAMREAARRGVRNMTLEVRASNSAAQALYHRFGFAPGGVRRNYYPEPREDALIMWAHDIDSPENRARLERIAGILAVPLVTEGIP